jgi:hypothetical protein
VSPIVNISILETSGVIGIVPDRGRERQRERDREEEEREMKRGKEGGR